MKYLAVQQFHTFEKIPLCLYYFPIELDNINVYLEQLLTDGTAPWKVWED